MDFANQSLRVQPRISHFSTLVQFPFDPVCGEIIDELKKRYWYVPGIKVKTENCTVRAHNGKVKFVKSVIGADFNLTFDVKQGVLPGGYWGYTAAVSEIVVRQRKIQVQDNGRGPYYFVYCGDDYEIDHELFVSGENSDIERFCTKYEGMCDCLDAENGFDTGIFSEYHVHPHTRSPLLVKVSDCGLGTPVNETVIWKTDEIMQLIANYLRKDVLSIILAFSMI